jgi:hypothetical protein
MPTRPFQRDDVLAVGEDDARDCDLVHRAHGLADHGEGIVADLAIGDDVVWPHQVQLSMSAFGTNSSMSMVRVLSSALRYLSHFTLAALDALLGVEQSPIHGVLARFTGM